MTNKNTAFWSLSLFLLVAPAHAQETIPAPPTPPVAPLPATGQTPAIRAPGNYITRTITDAGPKWLDEKIDVDITDVSILDAVKKVLEAAKVPDSPKVDADFPLPSDVHVTIKAKGVAARDALAAISRLGGANAFIGEENKKPMVWLRRRTTSVSAPMIYTTGQNGNAISVEVQKGVEDAYRKAAQASALASRNGAFSGYTTIFGGGHTLPAALRDKKVSLDARHSDIRDALKNVLKQVDLDFAMEEDVPDDKKSFTFEDVPVSTALDVICESAGIGWRMENGSAASKGTKKALVRIGKKYAAGASRLRSFGTLFDSDGFSETLSGVLAPLPALPIPDDAVPVFATPVIAPPVIAAP